MTKFKQLLVPAVVILMGAGAAFATNTAKVSDSDLESGYLLDNSTDQCVEKRTDCSPTGSIACTWESHDLYRISGTSCDRMLFEPEP